MSLKLHEPLQEDIDQVARMDRTLAEAACVEPDWRWKQARIYQEQYLQNNSFSVPPSEDDPTVLDLYSYLCFGSSGDPQKDGYIKYAISAVKHNQKYSTEARIMAYVVAKSTTEEIACQMGCAPESILMYELIFFDIRRNCSLRDYKSTIVFADVMKAANVGHERNERHWLNDAFYANGVEEISDIMNKKFDESPETALSSLEKVKANTVHSALQFARSRRVRGASTADDFDRLVSLGQALMQDKENEASSAGPDFERKLADGIYQALGVSISVDTSNTGFTITESGPHTQVMSPNLRPGRKPAFGCKVQKLSAPISNSSGRKPAKSLEFKI